MITFISFTDENMVTSACKCLASAALHGADYIDLYTKAQMEHWDIVKGYPDIFRQPEDPRRAWAWWAWKPAIIERALSELNDGDYLIYSDAGIEVVDNLKYITDRMDQDVWLFGNLWEHAHWCKRDVIDFIWPQGTFGKQVQATVIAFRASSYSRMFVKAWLSYCLHPQLINDGPSLAKNHPEFREHRHDQAILTTLAYRQGILLHWWPAMYNDGAFTYEHWTYKDDYPVLFHHHRRRDHEWAKCA